MTQMSTHYPDATRIEPVNRHTLAIVVDNEPLERLTLEGFQLRLPHRAHGQGV